MVLAARCGPYGKSLNQAYEWELFWIRLVLIQHVSRFPLGPYGQDEHHVHTLEVLVQGNVAGRCAPDDELSELSFTGAPHQRTRRKQVYGGNNVGNPLLCTRSVVLSQVLNNSIEVLVNARGEFDPSHERWGACEPGEACCSDLGNGP